MKKLNEFRYSAPEARMIVSTPRTELHETYREASAAIELYQAENAELTDSYLCELLQGKDPAGIMPKPVPADEPSLPVTKGLTDGELEGYWRSLDAPIKSLAQLYLGPLTIRDHPKIITEGLAYVISEIAALRFEPSTRPSVLKANFEMAKSLLQRTTIGLQSYLASGIYSFNVDDEHISEGGSNIFDCRYLSEVDRHELLTIRDARARARYSALQQHTRVPLPEDKGTGLIDTGQRQCVFGACEIRAVGGVRGQGKRRIEAFVPFNSPSAVLKGTRGNFVEVLMANCFSSALAEGNEIRALWNHDHKMPLGTTRNNTLEITQREDGLAYTCYPNLKTTWGQDCYESIKRGDVHNTSFQFLVEPEGERWPAGVKIAGYPVREVHNVRLLTELSPCTFGAYESSDVIAKGDE